MKTNKSLSIILALLLLSQFTSLLVAKDHNMPEQSNTQKHTNQLANESSPYLLSHAHNPVNWYPWGDEALSRARLENKPIFLSIGYAACHWCHVMERESFEDESIAKILNENFISIKVDREQRPDLDQIYMAFTTAMTGSGGWPMSVFLTPELKPFFAGTYFPPVEKYGRPSFRRLITEIAASYQTNPESIRQSSEDIYNHIAKQLTASNPPRLIPENLITDGTAQLLQTFDQLEGGFGTQPKFPHALELSLFLRQYNTDGDTRYLQAAELALKKMARGGIYDHLGGGFARYSTDRKWLVPHFEKMLYDNALLVPVYAEAWQVTHDNFYLKVVRETLDWLLNEMLDSTGAFYAALDADSEGEEGIFYLWSKSEIEQVLGAEEAERFIKYYNVTEHGNFEGHNILNITEASIIASQKNQTDDIADYLKTARVKLLKARSTRVRPLTDDKIITSWNGLALTALCRGYQVTSDEKYLQAALTNAEFITTKLWQDQKLTHAYREGRHSPGQFLEDYAYYIRGLIDLYESDHSDRNLHWLSLAVELADQTLPLFMDNSGGFFLRPEGHEDLIVRPKDEADGSVPAAGSIMIANLLRLNRLTGNKQFLASAEKAFEALSSRLVQAPSSMTSALLALDFHFSEKIEIVIVGQDQKQRHSMLDAVHNFFIPNRIIAVSNGQNEINKQLFEGRKPQPGEVSAYLCKNSTCNLPAATGEELTAQLRAL